VGTPGVVRAVTVTDPEGNLITFAEDLADHADYGRLEFNR
jgi:hypothetical protein